MTYAKGTRVRLSQEGVNRLQPRNPDREGVIRSPHETKNGTYAVVWEGTKSPDYYHAALLEAI